MKAIDRVSQVASEAHSGIGQAYLALGELDVIDGRGSVGVYRLREAAKQFDWCAERLRALAEQLEEKKWNGELIG